MGDEIKTLPVGTGPFKAVSYKRDVSLKFEKFNEYWQEGKPYLDGIEYVFIADAVTRLVSFKSGEAHVLLNVEPKDASDLQITGDYIINKTPNAIVGIAGDSAHEDSPFSDIRVRQALAYAIDNAAIAKFMGYGIYEATNQFSANGHYSYNPDVVGYPYDPQKARDLLASAGYPKGFTTTLTCQQTGTTMMSAIQNYLKEVNIDVKIDIADPGRWVQVQTGGWNNGLVQYDVSHSYGLDKGYSIESLMSNRSQFWPSHSLYIPTDYDTKLAQANLELNSEKRAAMLQDLMKIVTDQYCIAIPIYVSFGIAATSSEVKDLDIKTLADHIWHPADAWLSK